VYHAIVRRRVRGIFGHLSQQNQAAMVDGLAATFTYRFVGDSALSGIRTTTDEMHAWWARLFRLFPEATFDVRRVAASGWPWDTTIATHVVISGTRADGQPFENEFVQLATLAWGKLTDILTMEDTARLAVNLAELAAAGVPEADAAPIGRPSVIR
jgi:ketosteroid isomerase-like protein